MASGFSEKDKVVRIEFEDIYTDENMDKCPGYMYIDREVGESKRFVEVLVQCDKAHPHQERRKIVQFESGRKETQLVTCFRKSLKTMWEVA